MQLGLENRLILFLRLSNFDFKPFEFVPNNEKFVNLSFSFFRFPFPLLVFFSFNFSFFSLSSGVAMGSSGRRIGWTRDASLTAMGSSRVGKAWNCWIKNSCSVSGV